MIVSSEIEDMFHKYSLYAAAAFCKNGKLSIYLIVLGIVDYKWTCSEFCNGPTNGTIVFDYFNERSTDTIGYIALNHEQKSIILAFRGSYSIKNWIDDFLMVPSKDNIQAVLFPPRHNPFRYFFARKTNINEPPDIVRVHYGFFRSYVKVAQSVRGKIRTLYKSFNVSDYTLTVTGHSLGGAIASLAAADLIMIFPNMLENKLRLITFGQPRTGNLAFSRWYRQLPFANQIFRLTRFNDPVPRLPSKYLGYHHIGAEYYMNSFKHIWKCPMAMNETESRLCANVGRVISCHITCLDSNAWTCSYRIF